MSDDLSPFEIKDRLIELARSKHESMMLNAGRGNPDFIATLPRYAFLKLYEFSLSEAERSFSHLHGGFGGRPDHSGVVNRFDQFVRANPEEQGVHFLQAAASYANSHLGIQAEVFLSELVEATLGCSYPSPPRMLPCAEAIVREFIIQEINKGNRSQSDFELFATEGGTAAMTYLFRSLFSNGLLNKGDTIALATPIFSPYLEIPELPEYQFNVVEIESSPDNDWQLTEEALHKLENPAIKLLCVVNPANPTSVCMNHLTLSALADLVEHKRPDLMILTDDVYGTFTEAFRSLFTVCPRNTVCVYSFSKYYGATGWRLGTICLNGDNVFDQKLKALPEEEKEVINRRYSSLTKEPEALGFIDRLVADSRDVALNHTAGLSTPQQVQMTLFALSSLLDKADTYKQSARQLIHDRFEMLYRSMGIKAPELAGNAEYYTVLDLYEIAFEVHGSPFEDWVRKLDDKPRLLYRLAEETGVVLLPGKGFEIEHPSARVSLANLTMYQYKLIGQSVKRFLDEFYQQYLDEDSA
ncbi:aspartate aminotransferase [Endozoicomonas numazuensis]|uniref:Aminotransferase n=2 Tax=Endozoicomonas numazuensis TaxID=1137799 RepID=A0A081N3Y6_9GAMM|nr:aspartate aminotransferase [Endozoicomonas numazuensis]